MTDGWKKNHFVRWEMKSGDDEIEIGIEIESNAEKMKKKKKIEKY